MASKTKTKTLIRFDWAIKRLLRNKASYVVLEGFLSVLLKESIKIINISESEGNQTSPEDKFNRVDMLVENSLGELFIIEMQNNPKVDYYLRMIYGVSKAITERVSLGDEYSKVRKVYHINIIYFGMDKGDDYVYHGFTEFRGIHSNNVLELTPRQKNLFLKENVKDIFPEYYLLCIDAFCNVVNGNLDEWIYYLKNTDIPDSFTAPGLPEARRQLVYDNLSDEEKRAYEHYLKQNSYEQGVVEEAEERGRAEGRTEGRAEGEAERKQLEDKITQKAQDLAQKDKNLAQKDQEIEALQKQLAELKKQTQT